MKNQKLINRIVLFVMAFITILRVVEVVDVYASERKTVELDVTDTQNLQISGDENYSSGVDIKDGDIWLGDFLDEIIKDGDICLGGDIPNITGDSVSTFELHELLSYFWNSDGRIMDVSLSNTTDLPLDKYKEYEDKEYNVVLNLKQSDGIISKAGNLNVKNNISSVKNVVFEVNDEMDLKAPSLEQIGAEGYYWFKLETMTAQPYLGGDDRELFIYHVVNELEAKGDETYSINREDFIGNVEDGTLNGIYGCASIVNGKILVTSISFSNATVVE